MEKNNNKYKMHRVGFEPTQLTLPDLKSGSLDPSDIDAVYIDMGLVFF